MGKILILSVTDHEEHILNKIMETIANEPKLNHIAPPLPCNILSFKNLEIRLKEQTVSCRDQLVTLTHHEFSVLTYLARHPGWVFSASQIYEAVWDRDGEHCGTANCTRISTANRQKLLYPPAFTDKVILKPKCPQNIRKFGQFKK